MKVNFYKNTIIVWSIIAMLSLFNNTGKAQVKDAGKEGETIIFSESFEIWPPSGWGFYTLGATSPGWEHTTARFNSGSYGACHNDGNYGSYCKDWMLTPAINIESGFTYLSFNENQDWYGYYHLHKVCVLDGPDPQTANILKVLYSHVGTEDTWVEKNFYIGGYIGQTLYIGFYYEGNWDDTWYIDDIMVYESSNPFAGGEGTKGNPLLIETASQLNEVKNYPGFHYKLIADIDLSVYDNWVPIGSSSNKFTGSLDGNGKTISNLTIYRPSSDYQGLFGYFQPAVSGDSIKNLTLENVDITADEYIGAIAGAISNGKIIYCKVNADINGRATLGGIAGEISATQISECYSDCILNGSRAGGIAASASGASVIRNSYSLSQVSGGGMIGGILGTGEGFVVEYCYCTGQISADYDAGGIVGRNGNSTNRIINCFAANSNLSGDQTGRIIGENYISQTPLNNYAWNNMVAGDTYINNGELNNSNGLNITIDELKDSSFFTNNSNWLTSAWDFENTWTMDTSNISPFPVLKAFDLQKQKLQHKQILTWSQNLMANISDTIILDVLGGITPITYYTSDPAIATIKTDSLFIHAPGSVEITAIAEANNLFLSADATANFVIFNSGDGTKENPYLIYTVGQLDGMRYNLAAHYKLMADIDLSSIENWEPVGDYNDVIFSGSFDGGEHTISNLTINRPYRGEVGLFGSYQPDVEGDSIKNLTIENINIIGDETIGAISGRVEYGSIYNCHSSGKIKSIENTTGGIVGYFYNAILSNCSSSVVLESNSSYAGGIVGNMSDSYIRHSNFSGYIAGNGDIGGICGGASLSEIDSCYNTGTIHSIDEEAGGIIGSAYELTITNCYNLADIVGTDYNGGIVGYSYQSQISKCFNTGLISGNENIGGIVGTLQNNSSISQCYSTGNIVSNYNPYTMGGICGYLESSTLNESYSTGKVVGNNSIGGIVGVIKNVSGITNSIAINAQILAESDFGRILGWDYDNTSTLSTNYAWKNMYVGGELVTDGLSNNKNGKDTIIDVLSNEAFYTNIANWTDQSWDFTNTWIINTEVSPYPVLKNFSNEVQKVKHAQAITWNQDISTAVGESLKLTAVGCREGSSINYSSFEPEVASINSDTMFVNTIGAARIMAYVDGNEFFASDSLIKPIVNFSTSGTEEDPYLIYNLADLDAVRCNLNAHYKLMNDIDMSSIENWEPIGNNFGEFYGSFDGNNKALSNLTINKPNQYFVGLFGAINSAPSLSEEEKKDERIKGKSYTNKIKDLNIINSNVSGKGYVGVLSGTITMSTSIENVHISGEVNGNSLGIGGVTGYFSESTIENSSSQCNINGGSSVGGIAGCSENSLYLNCYSNGAIYGYSYEIGGITGYSYSDTIKSCFSAGNIDGTYECGGISGYATESEITNCYSAADIASDYNASGGIAGAVYLSKIINCYNTGIINKEALEYTGGVVGASWDNSQLRNNISIAVKVVGDNISASRILGYSGSSVSLINNYAWGDMYVNDSKIMNGSLANINGLNTSLSEIKSESFYTNSANWDTEPWDFTNTWEMNLSVSPYPILKGISADAQKVKHSQVMTTPWEQELPDNARIFDEVALSAIADGTSEMVAFSSDDNEVASIDGSLLTAQRIGSTSINVFYPETEFYKASNSFGKTIQVTQKADQTINWDQTLSVVYGDNLNLNATASSSLDVVYIINDETIADIYGNLLSSSKAGSSIITATQPGNNQYNEALPVELNLTVEKRNLVLSNFRADNKEYDGTSDASGAAFDDNRIEGDELNFTFTAAYDDKNVGNGKTINFSEIIFSCGADTCNYILSNTSGSTAANITPKEVLIGGTFSVEDKEYDGTVISILNGNSLTLQSPVSEEDVSLANVIAEFENANAGEDKIVSIISAELNGTDKNNYTLSLTDAPVSIGKITPKTLTIGGSFNINNREYNGTVVATLNENNLMLLDPVSGDNINLSNITIEFENANVAEGKLVSIVSAELEGTEKNNYTLSLTDAPVSTGNITSKTLTIGGSFNINNREYNGTVVATLDENNLILLDPVSGDNINLSNITIEFENANVAVDKLVSIVSAELDGTDQDNYSLSLTGAPSSIGNITPKTLTIGGSFTAKNKEYDQTTKAVIDENNLILSDIVEGDMVNLDSVLVEFEDANVGNGILVSITSAKITGNDSDNYLLSLSGSPTALADIISTTGFDKESLAGLKIYPNPFSDYIHIEEVNGIESITITNVLGQNVMNVNLNGQKTISTSHLDTGIYLISVKTENGQSAVYRMIKK